ncbi:MAG: glycine--tRNA ligase subunit beta [Clostridiales bacterium]|nr:glycine--tRNA ligase subunit beta [Clostridiales bacterium]MCF8021434.1 glycine--tRNA ligase subunit beta [Clostridiales bacterium]
MTKEDFLLEIGVEEMPARFLDPVFAQLKETAASIFKDNRLQFDDIITMGTPRRMTLLVNGVSGRQDSVKEEVKGPAKKVAFKDGEPTKAAIGFAKSQGVSLDDLVIKNVGHVEYVFAEKKEEGRYANELLTEMAPDIISHMHFPKSMRWGNQEYRFIRPVRWLVALYGQTEIPFEFVGVKSGRESYGHRFLSSGKVEISKPSDYCAILKESYVIAVPEERKNRIREQIEVLAKEVEGKIYYDESLINEVNNLVEYPTALCGSFDSAYLDLPPEVLITSMIEHQRFFPVEKNAGGLMPKFIAVNNGGAEYLDVIRAGNERVLKARLEDASFFWNEDLKHSLEARVEHLKKVVFQESLGTVYQKTERVSELVQYLIKILSKNEDDMRTTSRAAFLAKADLVTNMIYEFPELQGIMGREYALRSGEGEPVASAIYEHYLPRYAGDSLPITFPGQALSIADKIDTLAGCFSIGMQPTGSQDPYALRRQALGICNIILDSGVNISLLELIKKAYKNLNSGVDNLKDEDEVLNSLHEFFRQRVRVLLRDAGMAYDTVEAVLKEQLDDIADTCARGEELEKFRKAQEYEKVMTAYNRVFNLGKKVSNKQVRKDLLEDAAEKELYTIFKELEQKVQYLLNKQQYYDALVCMAGLKEPVDNYFEQVMVMVDNTELKENRLALLNNIMLFMEQVAELNKLEKENFV